MIQGLLTRIICVLFFWFFLFQSSAQQIKINEIMASNSRVVFDEDGSFEDWIELYNPGSNPVDLEGYGLSDNLSNPFKWIMPTVVMAPGQFLLVWASGKDRKPSADGYINGVFRKVYENISGGLVSDLLNHPDFPNNPDKVHIKRDFFEAPRDVGDEYGQHMYCLIQAPVSGEYTFWISGDDNSELYLSPDEDPAKAIKIAEVPEWTNPREWTKYPAQRSAKFLLEEGKRYYLSAYMKESFGGDNLAVMWELPDGQREGPIPANRCFVLSNQLHTNFRISASGESILLTLPDGSVSDLIDAIPIPSNISYGRKADGEEPLFFFAEPTPGASNVSDGFLERLAQPSFSHQGKVFSEPFQLTIQSSDPEALIFFTLDGSVPAYNRGILYTGPINISASTRVRAVAANTTNLASEIIAAAFPFAPLLNEFSSDLPIMVINQFDSVIDAWTKKPSYMTIIENDQSGRSPLISDDNLQSRIMIEIRGSSSQSFPKKGYGFHIVHENNDNRKEGLFGYPEDHNWVLHGPYTDKTLMRNAFAYDLSNDIGQYAPRTKFVELFLHDGNGPLSPNHYHGVYLLVERIKIAPGRVDLEELEPFHNEHPEVTGGYIFKNDRLNPGESGFYTARNSLFAHVRPSEDEISAEQQQYLVNYLSAFEDALFGDNFKDPLEGYAAYIDVQSFIDYHLLTELMKEIDGYRLSTFLYKDRLGKVVLGPLWDFNLSLGNANYLEGWRAEGWYYPLISEPEYLYGWFNRLFQDERFAAEYKLRYRQLRKTAFSNQSLVGKIQNFRNELAEAQVRNFQRWDVLGRYIWPNWFIGSTYDEEVNWMTDWLVARLAWMDQELGGAFNLVHYWNFNNVANYLVPSFTVGGATLEIESGASSEVTTGTGQAFTGENARGGDPAGAHLRINNPIGTEISFGLPSTGFKDIVLKYETRRSGSGANRQFLSYTVDGTNYQALDTIFVTEVPTVYTYDFSNEIATSDNSLFQVKIAISQEDDGTGGMVGNNRFDNVTLEGEPLGGFNFPPVILQSPELIELVAGRIDNSIDLSEIFSDPENDPLTFTATVENSNFTTVALDGSILLLDPLNQGETTLTISATDGFSPPVSSQVRVLVYPGAHGLSGAHYVFDHWSEDEAEFSYPDHMLFLQSDTDDPDLSEALTYAYYIPHNDYAASDAGNIGFPYRNESRTRLNGLEHEGISFINTGRGRDLGGALLAINTTGVDSVFVSWLGATKRYNSRKYNIRLQYRTEMGEIWRDIIVDDEPVEYQSNGDESHTELFNEIPLPQDAIGKDNVQLLWKYYYSGIRLDETVGTRDMLRLDDILVSMERSNSAIENAFLDGELVIYPNPSRPGQLFLTKPVVGKVFNLSGKLIQSINNQSYFSTLGMAAGMYVLRTESGKTARFVIY